MNLAVHSQNYREHQGQLLELEPGTYSFVIEDQAEGPHDPVAYLWLRSQSHEAALTDLNTGRCQAALWQKLHGFEDRARVRVKTRTVLHAMCMERDGFESKGRVRISRL